MNFSIIQLHNHSSFRTLDNSAIQSTIRSVFVTRLVGSSSVDCAHMVYSTLLPPLVMQFSNLFAALRVTENVTDTSRIESYFCRILHVFHAILTCSTTELEINGPNASYQGDIGTFYQQLVGYLSNQSQYHAAPAALTANSAQQIEFYSHLISILREIILRLFLLNL